MKYRSNLPVTTHGQHIGLYGGSFDPPHPGHLHVALTAKKCLELDHVWFLPSPGNPHKARRPKAQISERIKKLQALIKTGKSLKISTFECEKNIHFSSQSLAFLQKKHPHVRFVLIMGADNLSSFHHWHNWLDIAHRVPLVFVDRPGFGLRALSSKFVRRFTAKRLKNGQVRRIAFRKPPVWTFLHGRKMPHASSRLKPVQAK